MYTHSEYRAILRPLINVGVRDDIYYKPAADLVRIFKFKTVVNTISRIVKKKKKGTAEKGENDR